MASNDERLSTSATGAATSGGLAGEERAKFYALIADGGETATTVDAEATPTHGDDCDCARQAALGEVADGFTIDDLRDADSIIVNRLEETLREHGKGDRVDRLTTAHADADDA